MLKGVDELGAKIFPLVVLRLKRLLRQKKITYRQLAPKVGMSESGLKKMFTAKDISLVRLSDVCQVLGINLSDLLAEIERGGENYQYTFSTQQENYFLKDKLGFRVFWKLVYERLSPEDIRLHYQLNNRAMGSVLQKLVSLKLVKLRGSKVKVPRVREITWSRSGGFVKKILSEWSNKLVSDQLNGKAPQDSQHLLRYFCVQKHVYKELLEKLKSLEKEFLLNTVRDMNLYESKNLTHVGWLSIATPTSFVD